MRRERESGKGSTGKYGVSEISETEVALCENLMISYAYIGDLHIIFWFGLCVGNSS